MQAEAGVRPLESSPLFVDTPEGRFAYTDAGPRDPVGPASPPLVLVHGFTGHRDDFAPVLSRLSRTRRVLAFDLRGHGDSVSKSGVLGWSFDQLVKDLRAFVNALGLEQIDLLGHSMGGFVVQRFVVEEAPGRVRRLILLCTGPEVPPSLSRVGFEKAAAIAQAKGMEGLQALFEKAGRADPSPAIRSWAERYFIHQRRRFRAMTPESYAGLGRTLFDADSWVPRLAEIRTPTLVLVGESDTDWLPGAEVFLQTLPAAHRRILANAEHHPHQENPEAFFEALESFLDEDEG